MMSRIKTTVFACFATALHSLRSLARPPNALRQFRQNLAASSAPAAIGAVLILVLVGITPALSQPPAPDPLEVVEEAVTLLEPYVAPSSPPLPRPSDAELTALSNNAAMKAELLHECVLAVAVAGPLGTPCSAPAPAGPSSSSTSYWPESPQGNTPFGGGPLKPAFNCPYSQDSSVNIVTGEFVGRTCVFAANAHLGSPFRLILTYRSQAPSEDVLGHQWDHNFNKYLTFPDNSTVELHSGQARTYEYKNGTIPGTYMPPHGVFNNLTKTATGFRLVNPHGSTEVYNETGRLLSFGDAMGNDYSLSYDSAGLLSAVADAHGRSYTFAYDSSDRLSSMTSFDSKAIEFEYDSNGDLVKVVTPGPTTGAEFDSQFAYELGHRLSNATDNKGQKYLFNQYDAQGRVAEQTYGTGVHRFEYNPSASLTNVTDPNGNNRTYLYESFARPVTWQLVEHTNRGIEPSDRDSYHTFFVHDLEFQRAAILYPEGNAALFIFDDKNPDFRQRGNLIASIAQRSLDNPVGQVTKMVLYTYEPLYNLVKTVTDPRGLSPDYVPQNLGPTSPTRYTTTFYYDYEEEAGILPICQGVSVFVAGIGSVPPSPPPPLPGPSVPTGAICTTAHAPLGDINGDGKTNQAWGSRIRIDAPRTNPFGNPNPHMLSSSAFQDSVRTITYNDNGQIKSIKHPEANVDSFTYDASNFLECMTKDYGTGIDNHTNEPYRNLETCYTFDTTGNLVDYVDPGGNSWTRQYDKRNRVTEDLQPSPASGKATYLYDKNDNTIETRIHDGSKYYPHKAEYNVLDAVTAETLNASRPAGIVSAQPTDLQEEYYYDANGNLVLVKNPEAVLGNNPLDVTSYVYDERNLLHSESRGGVTGQFAGLAVNGGVPISGIVAPPDISTAEFRYDGNGLPTKGIGPQGGTTTNIYDGLGQLITTRDALGNEHHYEYDLGGYMVHSRAYGPIGGQGPGGAFNPANTGALNVLLSKATARYDERGRAYQSDVSLFDPPTGTPLPLDGPLAPGDAQASHITEYDAGSRSIRTINDNLHATAHVYDGADRLFRSTDALGNDRQYAYDANGNPTALISTEQDTGGTSLTYTATFTYDVVGRPVSGTDYAGSTVSHEYDARGNVIKTTDARGNTAHYTVDGLGRLWKTTLDLRSGGTGAGAVTDTIDILGEWDADSRLVQRVDDNGHAITTGYDSHGRPINVTMADGSTYTYAYDLAGNRISWDDPNGNHVDTGYDALNRPISTTATPGTGVIGSTTQTTEYNGLGQPTKLTDNNDASDPTDDSTVEFLHDSLGRATREIADGHVLLRTFDGVGNRKEMTYPNGRSLLATFDEMERLQTLGDAPAPPNPKTLSDIATFQYVGPGRVDAVSLQNGVDLVLGYDGGQRISDRCYASGTSSVMPCVSFLYDAAHNVVSRDPAHHSIDGQLFEYDSVDRLTKVERGTLNAAGTAIDTPATSGIKVREWSLDGANNWLSLSTTVAGTTTTETRTHSSVNELTERKVGTTTTPLAHDANGNLVDDGTLLYAYDFANRLRHVRDKATGGLVGEYDYDSLGRRTQKTLPTGSETYVYDARRVVEVRDGATERATSQIVYGRGVPITLDLDEDGDGITINLVDRRLMLHTDEQSSVLGVSDEDGDLVEGYSYDAYGERTVYEPGANDVVDFGGDDVVTPGGASAVGNHQGYIGQLRDQETGLWYLDARYYSPTLGRFLSRDPIGVWGDPLALGNGYAYAGSNPATFLDSTGLKAVGPVLAFDNCSGVAGVGVGNPGALHLSPDTSCARGCSGVVLNAGAFGGCRGMPGKPGCSGYVNVGVYGGCRGGDGMTPGQDGGAGCEGLVNVGLSKGCQGGNGADGADGCNGSPPESGGWNPEMDGGEGCNGGKGGAGCSGSINIAFGYGCEGGDGGDGGDGCDGADAADGGIGGGHGGVGCNGGNGGNGCDGDFNLALYGGCQGGDGGDGGDGCNGGDADGNPDGWAGRGGNGGQSGKGYGERTDRGCSGGDGGAGCSATPGGLNIVWPGSCTGGDGGDGGDGCNGGDAGEGKEGQGGSGGDGCNGGYGQSGCWGYSLKPLARGCSWGNDGRGGEGCNGGKPGGWKGGGCKGPYPR